MMSYQFLNNAVLGCAGANLVLLLAGVYLVIRDKAHRVQTWLFSAVALLSLILVGLSWKMTGGFNVTMILWAFDVVIGAYFAWFAYKGRDDGAASEDAAKDGEESNGDNGNIKAEAPKNESKDEGTQGDGPADVESDDSEGHGAPDSDANAESAAPVEPSDDSSKEKNPADDGDVDTDKEENEKAEADDPADGSDAHDDDAGHETDDAAVDPETEEAGSDDEAETAKETVGESSPSDGNEVPDESDDKEQPSA